MDIHPPEGPVRSFKDFAVHISIVTVGILIAFALEGLRELIADRHLVSETRQTIRSEMQVDHDHALDECRRVAENRDRLQALFSTLSPEPQVPSGKLNAQVSAVQNPGYFLTSQAWTAALSTGALAHMRPEEVAAYAYAAEATRTYTTLQQAAQTAGAQAQAAFAVRLKPTPEEAGRQAELLLLFLDANRKLSYVCPQMQRDIDRALTASSAK